MSDEQPVGDFHPRYENPFQSPTAAPLPTERICVAVVISEPLNPWFSMWLRPRATMRQIVTTDATRLVWILAAVQGFSQVLNRASMQGMGDFLPLSAVFVFVFIAGPIFGLIGAT